MSQRDGTGFSGQVDTSDRHREMLGHEGTEEPGRPPCSGAPLGHSLDLCLGTSGHPCPPSGPLQPFPSSDC